MEQIGVEIGNLEFVVETAKAAQDLFGELRLQAAVKRTAEEDTAASGSEWTYCAVVVNLIGTTGLVE